MAKEYFCCYHSYLEAMEQLNDAERGRLFTACLMYSKLGEAPELRGNERFIWPAFRSQIDRDNANYAERCRKQSENVKKRWERADTNDTTVYHRIPPYTNDTKEKEKEKEKTKEKEKESNNKAPTPDAQAELARLPEGLRPVMGQWLEYKQQRREKYTPVGLKSLISETINNANLYGVGAVEQVVTSSMASGYKGIVFDRLRQNSPQPVRNANTAKVQSGYYGGGNGQPSEWAKAAIARMMEEP